MMGGIENSYEEYSLLKEKYKYPKKKKTTIYYTVSFLNFCRGRDSTWKSTNRRPRGINTVRCQLDRIVIVSPRGWRPRGDELVRRQLVGRTPRCTLLTDIGLETTREHVLPCLVCSQS